MLLMHLNTFYITRAIKLLNLKNKRTSTTQTYFSSFRRENESQTYMAKTKSTQSAITKGQSMPKKLRYLKGINYFMAHIFIALKKYQEF